jgi:hypothetical protein
VDRTSLECTEILADPRNISFSSERTMNPSPPNTTRTMTVPGTMMPSENPSRFSEKREKPALQKALTLWKTAL